MAFELNYLKILNLHKYSYLIKEFLYLQTFNLLLILIFLFIENLYFIFKLDLHLF